MTGEAVLVTGGAGFIGSNLIDILLEKGHVVYVLDDLSTGKLENMEHNLEDPNFKFVRGDVCRPLADSLTPSELGDGPRISAVFHLAARVDVTSSFEDPVRDANVNYLGTMNVLTYALRNDIKRVVLTSSAAVYGDTEELPVSEEAPPRPQSPYGAHKLASEQLLRIFSEQYRMSCVSLRLFNVYGPRQDPSNPYSGVISKFIDWGRSGRPFMIYGDGEQTRDFIFVKDAALALYSAASAPTGLYNVGTGKETSVNDLASAVFHMLGKEPKVVRMPARKGEILRSCASTELSEAAMGFVPETDLKEGLRATLRWAQTQA